jgi:hypothetical protein
MQIMTLLAQRNQIELQQNLDVKTVNDRRWIDQSAYKKLDVADRYFPIGQLLLLPCMGKLHARRDRINFKRRVATASDKTRAR